MEANPSSSILIIGEQSCGKSSFLNFLKSSLSLPAKKRAPRPTDLREDIFAPPYPRFGRFEKHFLETKIDGERVGLTLWDSWGLDAGIIDLQLQEILDFIDSKFEETFTEETKLIRCPGGIQDTHIHVVFLLLDPLQLDRTIAARKAATIEEGWLNGKYEYSTFGVLDSLEEYMDLKVLRAIQSRCTIIPIISKADTVTTSHMNFLKRNIRECLMKAKIDPLELLRWDDNDNESSGSLGKNSQESDSESDHHCRNIMSPRYNNLSRCSMRSEFINESTLFPLSIISPDIFEPEVIGRQFPWGVASPLNEEHCDFVRLKNLVFSEYRKDLRQACWDISYERWRTRRLNNLRSRS